MFTNQDKMKNKPKPTNDNGYAKPILLPGNSFLDGFIKTDKSLRIECNVRGSILCLGKIYVTANATVSGEIICEELTSDGSIKGNLFCTGKVKLNEGAVVQGTVYTKLFENESNENMNCSIQIPSSNVIDVVREMMSKSNLDIPLSEDSILSDIIKKFTQVEYPEKEKPFAKASALSQNTPSDSTATAPSNTGQKS